MAQSDHRPRQARQTSRVSRLAGKLTRDAQAVDEKHRDEEAKTVAYIKRVLCPRSTAFKSSTGLEHKPLDELLPPLTSSNQVDIQLYAIIAVVLENFVQSWYQRITLDGEFIDEVVQIIAHCTRGIEQRLKRVDLEELLLDELPALLRIHVEAVETAQNACSGDRPRRDAGPVYHSIRPHKALTLPPVSQYNTLEQQDSTVAWSQLLISNILPLILPPEDLQNPCLHVLVSEIFSQIIVCNAICSRGSEPWVIWEGLTKLIASLRPNLARLPSPGDHAKPIDKLHQFGLLSAATTEQQSQNQQRLVDAVAQVLWSALHFLFLAWLLLRSIVRALMHDSSIPARVPRRAESKEASDRLSVTAQAVDPDGVDPIPQGPASGNDEKRPVVTFRIWSCMSSLTTLQQRTPWLFGLASLLQWILLNGPGKLCSTDGALDRLLSWEIRQRLLQPDVLVRILQASRSALFPEYALAPTRQPPTSAEALQLKRDCAKTIVEAIPTPARSVYFATKDMAAMQEDVERTLDVFNDPYINKHLIVSAVELVVVRLFPELGENVAED